MRPHTECIGISPHRAYSTILLHCAFFIVVRLCTPTAVGYPSHLWKAQSPVLAALRPPNAESPCHTRKEPKSKRRDESKLVPATIAPQYPEDGAGSHNLDATTICSVSRHRATTTKTAATMQWLHHRARPSSWNHTNLESQGIRTSVTQRSHEDLDGVPLLSHAWQTRHFINPKP